MAIDLRLLDDQLSILWFISSNLSLKLKLIPFFATWIGSWQYKCKISLAQIYQSNISENIWFIYQCSTYYFYETFSWNITKVDLGTYQCVVAYFLPQQYTFKNAKYYDSVWKKTSR